MALRKAAFASKPVESSVGSGASSGRTMSGISGAAKYCCVAATMLQRFHDFVEVQARLFREDRVDELFENDRVYSLAVCPA